MQRSNVTVNQQPMPDLNRLRIRDLNERQYPQREQVPEQPVQPQPVPMDAASSGDNQVIYLGSQWTI